MRPSHVFFDIGGVLGTNGWDQKERSRAAERFGLDDEFEQRHAELVGELETGSISLEDYLRSAVFYRPRDFSRDDFVEFMLAQSQPYTDSITLVARVAARDGARLFTLNNESEALNQHRIEAFGLRPYFIAFLSSCWLGALKPSRLIFERALGIAQVAPADCLFVDDREQNLQPARELGMAVHHFTGAPDLERCLADCELI